MTSFGEPWCVPVHDREAAAVAKGTPRKQEGNAQRDGGGGPPILPRVSNALTAAGAIVVGPKTRLGQAVIERLPAARTALVARNHDENVALQARWPDRVTIERDGLSEIVQPWSRVAIFACAIGSIHPGDDGLAHTSEAAARDLAIIRAAMNAADAKPVHVIFVS